MQRVLDSKVTPRSEPRHKSNLSITTRSTVAIVFESERTLQQPFQTWSTRWWWTTSRETTRNQHRTVACDPEARGTGGVRCYLGGGDLDTIYLGDPYLGADNRINIELKAGATYWQAAESTVGLEGGVTTDFRRPAKEIGPGSQRFARCIRGFGYRPRQDFSCGALNQDCRRGER